LLCLPAILASPAVAGGARYFKYKDNKGGQILLRATRHRVLSGMFMAKRQHTLECDDDGVVLVGGFPIKSAKVAKGRFHAIGNGYMGEGGSWTLTIKGTLKGDAIRGVFAFHFVNRSAEGSFECWSGKGEANPVVSYLARSGGK
jgi:hypothetical protein